MNTNACRNSFPGKIPFAYSGELPFVSLAKSCFARTSLRTFAFRRRSSTASLICTKVAARAAGRAIITASYPVSLMFPASDLTDSLRSLLIRFLRTAFPSLELDENPNLATCLSSFLRTLRTRSLFTMDFPPAYTLLKSRRAVSLCSLGSMFFLRTPAKAEANRRPPDGPGTPAILHGQFHSALGAARPKHSAAACAGHPRHEAVCSELVSDFGLIGSLGQGKLPP